MVEQPLLQIRNLTVNFYTDSGVVHAVDDVSFDMRAKTSVGLVGESGCGKSVTARALLNIVQTPGKLERGKVLFYPAEGGDCVDLLSMDPNGKAIREYRGRRIAMIFQDPMTCLSPVHTIGNQIVESIRTHYPKVALKEAREKAAELLDEVGIPKPKSHLKAYSFELSGGMRQRALMAVALAAEPDLLIADEPTTAIDVTIQAKFLDLLSRLEAERDMSVLFITHDLGVIAQVCREVIVMYLGKVVEMGTAVAIYDAPRHPYTQLLFKSIPRTDIKRKQHLAVIGGMLPDAHARPRGCLFSDRCPEFMPGTCEVSVPPLVEVGENHYARCHLYAS
jgi:oligopeptide/dipeptide ABC transporter ATP-binding protein